MPRICLVSSAMHPTPDIGDSVVCAASSTRHCTTNKPNSDGALHGPGEAECARDNVRRRENAEFGATNDKVVELPGKRSLWCMEVAVSSNTAPTACRQIVCGESCERVSSEYTCDDIIQNSSQ